MKIFEYLQRLDCFERLRQLFEGKRVLVIGGAGAIGSNLVEALSELVGVDGVVTVLDDFSSASESEWLVPQKRNVSLIEGSICNRDDVLRCFRSKKFVVFHLAAFFANQKSIDYVMPSVRNDILGHVELLEIVRLVRPDRFIYASSGCSVYGSTPPLPVKEDYFSMHMTTPYQINKMVGEMYNNFYFHHYGLPIVNCRFFNSYGPGEIPGKYRNVIPNFIWKVLKAEDIPLTGAGDQTRDFTFVYDLIQGLLKSALYPSAIGQSFNLASGQEVPIVGMAEKIKELIPESNSQIKTSAKRKWDTKVRMWASINLAHEIIDYAPIVSFDDGLEITVNWYRANEKSLEKIVDFDERLVQSLVRD